MKVTKEKTIIIQDKLIQEAIDFMLSETEKHDKNWKGYTMEEWMVAFAKEQIEQLMEVAAEEVRKRKKKDEKWYEENAGVEHEMFSRSDNRLLTFWEALRGR